MVRIVNIYPINSGNMDVLPTFSGTAGVVINAIEDPMSSTTDLVKSMDPSMACAMLGVANTACFGVCNFRNITSIEHTMEIAGLQEAKEDREHTIAISLGNMFAKMIRIGDNFSSFYEFINKYRNFVCVIEDPGTMFIPAEKVIFFNAYLYCKKIRKVFSKRC
jgi:hypothetical protein